MNIAEKIMGFTDEQFEELKKYFDENEIVETVGVIALFGLLNRRNLTIATDLESPAERFNQCVAATTLDHRP